MQSTTALGGDSVVQMVAERSMGEAQGCAADETGGGRLVERVGEVVVTPSQRGLHQRRVALPSPHRGGFQQRPAGAAHARQLLAAGKRGGRADGRRAYACVATHCGGQQRRIAVRLGDDARPNLGRWCRRAQRIHERARVGIGKRAERQSAAGRLAAHLAQGVGGIDVGGQAIARPGGHEEDGLRPQAARSELQELERPYPAGMKIVDRDHQRCGLSGSRKQRGDVIEARQLGGSRAAGWSRCVLGRSERALHVGPRITCLVRAADVHDAYGGESRLFDRRAQQSRPAGPGFASDEHDSTVVYGRQCVADHPQLGRSADRIAMTARWPIRSLDPV